MVRIRRVASALAARPSTSPISAGRRPSESILPITCSRGARIAHHADDGVGLVVCVQMLAERFLSGEILFCKALADDDLVGLVEADAGVECASAQERNAHGRKVTRVGGTVQRPDSGALGQR